VTKAERDRRKNRNASVDGKSRNASQNSTNGAGLYAPTSVAPTPKGSIIGGDTMEAFVEAHAYTHLLARKCAATFIFLQIDI
jgi:hypothetical protein